MKTYIEIPTTSLIKEVLHLALHNHNGVLEMVEQSCKQSVCQLLPYYFRAKVGTRACMVTQEFLASTNSFVTTCVCLGRLDICMKLFKQALRAAHLGSSASCARHARSLCPAQCMGVAGG